MNKAIIDKNPVVKISFEFSIDIIKYCERLQIEKKFVIANQLLKCGTSIGANIIEAQNAESKADFIYKFKIASKEGEETEYFLLLCKYSADYPDCKDLLVKIESLNKMIGKIISTTKKRIQ